MFLKCNTRQIISGFCSFNDRQARERRQNRLRKPEENISLQNNLSSSQMELKAQLQKATEDLQQRGQTINSLRSELSVMKNHLGEISSSDMKKQLQEAQGNMKRRDEELVSLKQLLHTQQTEMEELRASLQDSKTSQKISDIRGELQAGNQPPEGASCWERAAHRQGGEKETEKTCCICWYLAPSDLHTGCTPTTRGERCSCGIWTCD